MNQKQPRYRFDRSQFVRRANETPQQQKERILHAMRPAVRNDPARCAMALKRALEIENATTPTH